MTTRGRGHPVSEMSLSVVPAGVRPGAAAGPLLMGITGVLLGPIVVLLGRPTLGWSLLAFCVAVAVVEAARTSRPDPPPLLTTHSALAAWAMITLAPWIARGTTAYWPVPPEGYVLPDLAGTWTINLAALGGIAIVTLAAVPRHLPRIKAKFRVRWSLATAAVLGLVLMYVAGSLAAGRTLTSLWRLGASSRYADFSGSSGLGLLEVVPVVLMVLVLGLTAVRRTYLERPNMAELAVVAGTAVLLLGLAVRYRLIILVAGWFVLQWWSRGPSRQRGSTTLRIIGTSAVGGVLLAFAGYVSAVRQGGNAGTLGQLWDRVWSNLDVVSSAELMTFRGASPGMLGGASYTQLPALFLPRAIVPDKPYPAAQDAVNTYLNPFVGYSAPAWFEGWLNFGLFGAAVVAGVVTLTLLGAWRAAATRADHSRAWFTILALGPVFPLLGYQLLSRLLAFQAISTLLAFALGVFLVALVVVPRGRAASEVTDGLVADPSPATAQSSPPLPRERMPH